MVLLDYFCYAALAEFDIMMLIIQFRATNL